jgi:NAD+ kinase
VNGAIEIVRPEMGTIGLYVDTSREHARSTAAAVARTIREAGFGVALHEDQRELALADDGAALEDAVLLVTVGGDGTLLRAAQIAAPHRIPLYGINTGRLGFLTESDGKAENVGRLATILREGFTVDERVALRAAVHGREHLALNEIVVRRTQDSHMTPFGIYVDGKEAAVVPADGVVVATPTGSTGYFLSAGGPILSPAVAALGIIALLPHTLFTRPLVVPDSSEIALLCDAETVGVVLEADGRSVARLHPGDRVEVTRSPSSVRFARRAPLDFFTLLEDKLRWNAPLKERERG